MYTPTHAEVHYRSGAISTRTFAFLSARRLDTHEERYRGSVAVRARWLRQQRRYCTRHAMLLAGRSVSRSAAHTARRHARRRHRRHMGRSGRRGSVGPHRRPDESTVVGEWGPSREGGAYGAFLLHITAPSPEHPQGCRFEGVYTGSAGQPPLRWFGQRRESR